MSSYLLLIGYVFLVGALAAYGLVHYKRQCYILWVLLGLGVVRVVVVVVSCFYCVSNLRVVYYGFVFFDVSRLC